MANIKQIIGVLAGSAIMVVGLTMFVSKDTAPSELLLSDDGSALVIDTPLTPEVLAEQEKLTITNNMNPVAVFSTNKGVIEIELFADQMPITTGNFIKLTGEGYYNETKFHRVIDGFMIQGGDSNSKGDNTAIYGQGGPGYTIQDEFIEGELLTNTRGTISMANTGQPNSGGSQFFINTVDNINLDFNQQPPSSKHPVFGRIVAGMDVVDMISTVPVAGGSIPVEPIVVESVTIRTEG
jgi:peptidylprolyl isomerase